MAPTGLQGRERQGGSLMVAVPSEAFKLHTFLPIIANLPKIIAPIDPQRTDMCQYFNLTIITSSKTVTTEKWI